MTFLIPIKFISQRNSLDIRSSIKFVGTEDCTQIIKVKNVDVQYMYLKKKISRKKRQNPKTSDIRPDKYFQIPIYVKFGLVHYSQSENERHMTYRIG